MPQKNTVTILAPDGTPGDIPAENVPHALAAGGKIGVHVYDPNGNPGYVAHDVLGDALKAGATYAPPSKSSNQGPQGFIQSLLSSSPAGVARGLVSNITQQPQNQTEENVGTASEAGGIPRQMGLAAYRTLIAPSVANARSVVGDIKNPNLPNLLAAPSEALAAIPLVGQAIDAGRNALQQGVNGDVPGAAGSVAGNLLTAGMAGRLMAGSKPIETNLTPQQVAARNVAKAVLPKEANFDALTDALQREKGNVEQYAAQSGLTTKTPLSAGIAARQSADSLGDFYRNNILGPNADKQVSVPMHFDEVGTRAPSGSRYASLGDIDQRIQDLNDIIRPARNNATQGATATDLQNLAKIVAEHDSLVDILHKNLGQATNLDPSVIAGVRKSIGARSEIADQLNSSANQATLSAGRMDRTGSTIAKPTLTSTMLDVINRIRGGPEAIANRAFQKTYPKLDVTPNVGNPATLQELRLADSLRALGGNQ